MQLVRDIFLRAVLTAGAVLFSLCVMAAEWERLPPMPVEAGQFVCGAIDGKSVILGGVTWQNDEKVWLDGIWVYDLKARTWSRAGTLPEAVAYAPYGQSASCIYFAGGCDSRKMHLGFYAFGSDLQRRLIAEIPGPLLYAGAVVCASRLLAISGGTDVNDLGTLNTRVCAISLSDGKTVSLPAYPGGKTLYPAVATLEDSIYSFGGGHIDSSGQAFNLDCAYVYSLAEGGWSPILSYPAKVRCLAACTLDNRYILVGGGYKEDFTDEAFLYDTQTDVYIPTRSLPYPALTTFLKAGDYLYVAGGEDRKRHRTNLFYRILWKDLLEETLDPTATKQANAPVQGGPVHSE